MADNIKVAVRIRSSSPKTPKTEKIVLKIEEPNSIRILADKKSSIKRFDHVFWSCDGYKKREDGYLEPDGPQSKYADQKRIFEEIGKELLGHLFKGFNCTLFAYGQTGSGKSYTMMERGANKGLLPRMTEEIFQTVNDNNDPNLEYQVLFSMMEIYNEQVFDLFEDVPKNAKRTMLKIYENKASNLLCVPVSNKDEVASFLIKGYQNRTIASTNMNEYSSRAHTIATIYVKQIQSNAKATLSSQISIVDLAGSERAAKTKAIGVRLKQGANINLSLMHLGTVIRTLAKKPGHQNQKPMHRNSKLTLLLKDSLGGNSKTVMLATVSPLQSNLEETKSTLEYAFDAKSIRNNSTANECEHLNNSEVEDLMGRLQKIKAELNKVQQEKEKREDVIKELNSDLENLREQLRNALKKDEEPLKENLLNQDKRVTTVPHFLNLNEDHMLSKLVRCYIEKGQCIHIGGKNTDVEGEHILVASEIDKIGQISNREGQVFLQTFRKNAIALNGQRIVMNLSEQRINSGDRLMFGSLRSLWIFVDPTSDKPNIIEDDFTYDDAENEIIMLTNTEETIPADDMALRRKLIKRAEEVKEANFKAVLSNKPLVFSLALTSAYFLGLNEESNVVIVKIWNRKSNCRYIWTENEFVRAMDDIYEFKIDCENDFDPFDITPDSYTPVGASFVKRDDSGRKQKAKYNKSDLLDQKGSKIGHLCSSFEVTETPRTKSNGSQIRIRICIDSATLVENLKDRYLKVKCSFRLPYTSNEEEDPRENETAQSPGEAPFFNFDKQFDINERIDLLPKFLLVRLWGIPRPTSDLYVERGDLAEIVVILEKKDDLIERLRKERNEYKKQVEDLQKALQNKQNKI